MPIFLCRIFVILVHCVTKEAWNPQSFPLPFSRIGWLNKSRRLYSDWKKCTWVIGNHFANYLILNNTRTSYRTINCGVLLVPLIVLNTNDLVIHACNIAISLGTNSSMFVNCSVFCDVQHVQSLV